MMTEEIDPAHVLSDTVAHKPDRVMASSSTHARAVRSSQALREALLELLDRRPFDQITVREICGQAGVHYATFFRHYVSKEALLDAIAAHEIEHLNRLTVAIRAATDFREGFRALCAYVEDHRSLWSILLNGGAGPAMKEEWLRQAKMVAATQPPSNSWLPAELGVVCASTVIAESLAWWVGQPADAYSVEEFATILFRLVTNAFLTPD